MPEHDTQVLIVGAGPSGTMAALLLQQLGISTIVVERRDGAHRAPAAHVVNARTLEICRAAGVDMAALDAAAKKPADAGRVYWVDKLGGEAFGSLPYERQGDDQLHLTPTPLRNVSQHRFEPILLDALQRRGSEAPRWRHQWDSASQDADGVRSQITDLESGVTYQVDSKYMIAADGAGSRVRKSLGIDMIGPERLQSFLMIHFRANLRRIAGDPPGVLHFICDPAVGGGVFVVHDLDREAVFMHSFDPDRESTDDFDVERCEALVRQALDDPTLDFEIANVGTWMMTAQVAERYRDRRIFIVGDAAHRFPPTGGLGLNSGVQDVHNLAWKLAAVIDGWAPAGLLETFERERRPVAQRNADQSLGNALRLLEVPEALGITASVDESQSRMAETLSTAAGREKVSQAIDRQAEHFDMPGLQLGFCYTDGALVGAGEAAASDEVRNFVPSGRPGCRAPHAWTSAGESILDWIPLDRFFLLAGPEGNAWVEAAKQIGDIPIAARRILADELTDLPAWLDTAGISSSGALLVRPDQHVAWRCREAVADPAARLDQTLRRVLSPLS